MSRAFGTATGHARSWATSAVGRLSIAARTLAAGAPDILAALDAGDGSHEAFTRAFRDQSGLTPEQVRVQGTLANIRLVEPIDMDQVNFVKLEPPRFIDGKAILPAGLSDHHTFETRRGIPSLWRRFGPHFAIFPVTSGRSAMAWLRRWATTA